MGNPMTEQSERTETSANSNEHSSNSYKDNENITTELKIKGKKHLRKNNKKPEEIQEVKVGKDHQATIPELSGNVNCKKYFENQQSENLCLDDKIIWDPSKITNDEITKFLLSIQPLGFHISSKERDDEKALYVLQQSNYNFEEAIARLTNEDLHSNVNIWSEDDCQNFEDGLRNFGKNFWKISQNYVKTKSTGELVQFYYLWKKSERHDQFVRANKTRMTRRKKFDVNPGNLDLMEEILQIES